MEMTPSQAIARLREWREMDRERDQRVWDAHESRVAKTEIAEATDLSWQTVDRIIRKMAAKQGGEDSEED